MKNIAISLLCLIISSFLFMSCNNQSSTIEQAYKINSIDEAIELTKATWDKYHIVYALKDAIKPHTTLTLDKYTDETFTIPDDESWMIFIYHVDINVMHCYTWIVVNRKTGKITEVTASDPPATNSNLTYEEQQKTWITIKDTWSSKFEQ